MLIRQLPTGEHEPLEQNLSLEGLFKPKPERVKWVTPEIAERFDHEYYLVTTAKDLIFYFIFLFCATMTVLVRVHLNAYYMTYVIKGQVVDNFFDVEGQNFTFDDITTLSDVHKYLTEMLAYQLYWTSFDTLTTVQLIPKKDRGVLYSNKLIGEPTMRQIAIKLNSCEIHPRFQRWFNNTCRDRFWNSKRQKNENLQGCKAPDTACTYSDAKTTLAVGYYGKFGHYRADGYQVKMGQDREKFIQTAESLKKGWYMEATRVVFLDFMLFNPNLNLFCAIKLVFELPPTGGVIARSNFHTFRALEVHGSVFGQFSDGCFIVYACFILFYIAEEIREIIFLKLDYLKLFWSYMDVAIVLFVVSHIILTLKGRMMAKDLVEPMSKNSAEINDYSLQKLADLDNECCSIQGIAIFLIYMKLFKYLSLNVVTGQLNNTLKRSGRYLAFFSFIFMVVMFAFGTAGYLVFGREIEEYHTLPTSMFTLFRTLLGDFDYEKIEIPHNILAPIFFVLYIFLVFFIMVNMFLAIVCGNYSYVKTDTAVGPEIMQMTEFWKRGFYGLCSSMGCLTCAKLCAKRTEYNVAAEQIRGILNKCGFTNLEIDLFMSRYGIEPSDLVKVYDISRLIEFLRIPAAENMTPRKGPAPVIDTKPTGPPLVGLEDFQAQQKKLDEIETYMTSIADKVDALLRKMNALTDVRK